MPTIDDVYGSGESDKLKAADLKKDDGTFRVVQCVVERAEVVNFSKDETKPQNKVVLHLVDKPKSVVVNFTNAGNLSARYGPDYTQWVGKTILISASPKKYNGQMVDGIDIQAPMVPDAEQEQDFAANAGPAAGDIDVDDVPF